MATPVMNVDVTPPAQPLCHFFKADLTDLGQAVEACVAPPARSIGGVRRSATPASDRAHGRHPGAESRARRGDLPEQSDVDVQRLQRRDPVRLKRVVWASSETAYGLPLTREAPKFAPVTEDHPLVPETDTPSPRRCASRWRREMARWNPGTSFSRPAHLQHLRAARLRRHPSFWDDAALRRWNLWSWVDARDVAQACRLALEADMQGAEHFTIAAADTLMREPSAALMAKAFPGVPVKPGIGEFDTLLSIDKARRVLGYQPKHTWRGQL